MKKSKIILLSASLVLLLSSCATLSVAHLTSSNMNKLEIGMSKEQVTTILGNDYTIAEKYQLLKFSTEEVLSYRDHYKNDEFYMFHFSNNKLVSWKLELLPKKN